MQLVVQKYGGSSLASNDQARHVAQQVVARARQGDRVVVVVSARGKTTNQLMALATELTDTPPTRELDILLASGEQISRSLLAVAIHSLGEEVISLSGPQAGIRTNARHFNADIVDVEPGRIAAELDAGRIVVVAGFQGLGPHGELTTLGRGGSDTTAVALAAALEADHCEICSDVEGVWSADPRKVETAFPLSSLDYLEMLELSRYGAGVLHPEAVAHAARTGVEIVARSCFDEGSTTRVRHEPPREPTVTGVTSRSQVLWLSGREQPHRLDEAILDPVAHDQLLVHELDGLTDLLVPYEDVPEPGDYAETVARHADQLYDIVRPGGSVTAVGQGLGASVEPAHEVSERLQSAGIEVFKQLRSEHSWTWVLPSDHVEPALNTAHSALLPNGNAGAA